MKKNYIILSALTALAIASCSDVPDDVRSRTEAKNQAVSEAQKHLEERTGEIEWIDRSELEENAKEALTQSYANFTIDPSVKIDIPEKIVKLDLTQVDDYGYDPQKLMERIAGKEYADAHSLVESDITFSGYQNTKGSGMRVEEDKFFLNCQSYGLVCLARRSLFANMYDVGQRVAIYHVDRGDDLSDAYLLGDKEVSVREAAEAAQKFIDEVYADCEPDYDIRVKTVIARQDDYGDYSLDVTAVRYYKGIQLSDLRAKFDPKEIGKTVYNQFVIELIMQNGTDIDFFHNGVGIFKPTEKGTLDRLVSLKSALEHMEREFTEFQNPPVINSIALRYLGSPDYDYKNKIPFNQPGTINKGKIVWEFVIDATQQEIDNYISQTGNIVNDIRKYVYIDAETGEMEFEFEILNLT